MLTWVIFGLGVPGLEDLKIRATSFDEALEMARAIDSRYSGGYVADNKIGGAEHD